MAYTYSAKNSFEFSLYQTLKRLGGISTSIKGHQEFGS
jgi:hypothetical protein